MCITHTRTHADITQADTEAHILEHERVYGHKYTHIPLYLQRPVNRVHLKCDFIQFVLVSEMLTPAWEHNAKILSYWAILCWCTVGSNTPPKENSGVIRHILEYLWLYQQPLQEVVYPAHFVLPHHILHSQHTQFDSCTEFSFCSCVHLGILPQNKHKWGEKRRQYKWMRSGLLAMWRMA